MKPNLRFIKPEILEGIIRIGVLFMLSLTLIIMGIAFFDPNTDGEAHIGSFKSYTFNEGWQFKDSSDEEKVVLPISVAPKYIDESGTATIVNTLPNTITHGMNLMVRANMSDVYIYIDGKLRSSYASDPDDPMTYYIPSAYVVADLQRSDAGKEIEITMRFKTKAVINDITLSYGNNAWFTIINKGLLVNFTTLTILIVGIIVYILSIVLRGTFKLDASRYLGLLIIDITLWIISESTLRQLFFTRPSLSQYFSYFLIEMMGALACLFFDEVQHKVYHTRYLIMEFIVLTQIIINTLLRLGGIAPLFSTLLISHFWLLLCAVVSLINIATDIKTKRVREYRITMVGMILFIVISLNEFLGFYINKFHVFGTEICIGLIALTVATLIQTAYDEKYAYDMREKNYTLMTVKAIETIAAAIDAKDEYTGGHSERVGMYAERLAREMAADYDFTEDDILQVHYIGLVHDIGKIGVADSVLNKSGKLTDEEFSLMKRHTEIGYEMMLSLGDGMNGLLDGIRHHHERFDGTGYPDRLVGTEIPLVARILALADAFDAMTSNRVYRLRLSNEEARNEILRCSGTQFDPALVEIFVKLIDRKEITPFTLEGSAIDENGNVRNSALLEKKLVKDLMEEKNILNPSHVRMLCYVIKLMEHKGKDFEIIFAENPASEDDLKRAIKEYTSLHDVTIKYTDSEYIIALYDRTEVDTLKVVYSIKDACPMARLEKLSPT